MYTHIRYNKMTKYQKADRRERFMKLYPNRLEKALKSIRSIGKLSEQTNYIYTEKEVAQIIHDLETEVRATMILFLKGSGSVEDRYKRILDFDYEVIRSLETKDPELFDYILKKQSLGSSALVEYFDERKRIDESLDIPELLSETNESSGNKDLHAEILEIKSKINSIQEKLSKIK